MTYKIDEENQVLIKTNENGSISYIPINESNADYQAYLTAQNEAAK